MARTLKVGVSGNAPFVIQKDGGSSGISLDIWRRIAEDNNLSYRLIKQATPRQGILALNKGEIDLLVGPISITPERLNLPGVDFTQPYFIGKEGILLPLKPTTLLNPITGVSGMGRAVVDPRADHCAAGRGKPDLVGGAA